MAMREVDPLRVALSKEGESAYHLDYLIAYTTLRLALGLDEILHGATRLFFAPLSTFVNATQVQFQNAPLPVWQVRSFATVVPIAEFIFGILLILGLWTRWALALAAVLMLGIIFGTGMRADWTIVALQLFYSLTYALALMWRRYDGWSLDALMGKK
jgi:thiosulfate dehydrogenase (quinone) large subunit